MSTTESPGQALVQWWCHSTPSLRWTVSGAALLGGAALVVHLRRWWKLSRNRFPTVPGWPIVGVAPEIMNEADFLPAIRAWSQRYGAGGVFEFNLMGDRTIALCDWEHLLPVLKLRPFRVTRSTVYSHVGIATTLPSLAFAEGKQWSRQRRLLSPAFNAQAVKKYLPDICNIVSDLLQQLEQGVARGESTNVSEKANSYSWDVLLKLYGQDSRTLELGSSKEMREVDALLVGIQQRYTSPLPYWRLPRFLRKLFDGYDTALQNLRAMASEVLRNAGSSEKSPFLSRLVQAEGESLSTEEVISNLIVFLFAGTGTTGHTLVWALYQLARHPDVQREVAAEVDALSSGMAMADSLDSLLWVQAVWQETLRLNAVNHQIEFENQEEIEIDGRVIPPGTQFWALFQEATRRSAAYKAVIGDDWDAWRPERWFAETDASGRPMSLKTCAPFDSFVFGHGARSCPGKLLANTVGPLAIAEIMKKYSIAQWIGPPMGVTTSFIVVEEQDIKLRFYSRA